MTAEGCVEQQNPTRYDERADIYWSDVEYYGGIGDAIGPAESLL